jgi:hypothetical protein
MVSAPRIVSLIEKGWRLMQIGKLTKLTSFCPANAHHFTQGGFCMPDYHTLRQESSNPNLRLCQAQMHIKMHLARGFTYAILVANEWCHKLWQRLWQGLW